VPAPAPPPVPEPEDPFAFLNKPAAKPGGAPTANPFAGDPSQKPGGNPFATSPNPYAAPAGGYEVQKFFAVHGGQLANVEVGLDPIMNHAWRTWQNHLGLLVGITVIVAVISNAIELPLQLIQGILAENNQPEAALAVGLLGFIANVVISVFLGIGQVQVALKLARGERAQVGDLFGGGGRFLPVLGASLLAGIALFFGFAACIVPGILLMIWFWPFYYLVVDDKAGVVDSFSLAAKITERNRVTTLVLWLVSFGIILLGLLVCCIGVFLAAPLVSLLWATAYLMMSGQLSPQPQLAAKY
jgi:hypothetical protein